VKKQCFSSSFTKKDYPVWMLGFMLQSNLLLILCRYAKSAANSDPSKLDSAAQKLGVVLASYGAGKLDKLADVLKLFKSSLLKAMPGQGISSSARLTEVLGWQKAMARLPRFNAAAIGLEEVVKKLEANPQILDALEAAEKAGQGSAARALDSILDYGPEAVEILARRGKPSNLSQGGLLNQGQQGLGENLEAWAKRLSEVSPAEGAEILDRLKHANEIRDTIRKPTGGKIKNTQNVGFTDNFEITIPNRESVTGNRSTHIGISGRDEYQGALPISQNPAFSPEDLGFRDNSTDSEFKILNKIAQSIQQRFGVSTIDEIPITEREAISGNVKLFTERKPCDACLPLIESTWKEKFPNIKIQVVHGPDAKAIRRKTENL
jgi:hypothetical protein